MEQRSMRFIPSQNADGQPIDATSVASHNSTATHSPAPQVQPQQPQEFVHHLYTLTPNPSLPIAPIANMGPTATQLTAPPPAATANAMVDPELMGQGVDEELQKMAGEAIAHSTAMHAQQGEDENERELRTRLGGFIGGEMVQQSRVQPTY